MLCKCLSEYIEFYNVKSLAFINPTAEDLFVRTFHSYVSQLFRCQVPFDIYCFSYIYTRENTAIALKERGRVDIPLKRNNDNKVNNNIHISLILSALLSVTKFSYVWCCCVQRGCFLRIDIEMIRTKLRNDSQIPSIKESGMCLGRSR